MITEALTRIQESWGYGPNPVKAAKAISEFIVSTFNPKTVIDVGCGSGALVHALRAAGVDAKGYDLAPAAVHVDKIDLTTKDYSIPKADVLCCLEVAEHLDDASGRHLVRSLVASGSPVIIFAAGIPLQGGWKHRNERWQSYWASQFEAMDLVPHDDLRMVLWDNPSIAPWYSQDAMIYASKSAGVIHGLNRATILDVVHPRSWESIGLMGIYQRLCSKCFSHA